MSQPSILGMREQGQDVRTANSKLLIFALNFTYSHGCSGFVQHR